MAKNTLGAPHPPTRNNLPLIHASAQVEHWLAYYWEKLKLPSNQLRFLAITMNRQEFAEWTGRRLQSMALGCYCYLPLANITGAATDHSAAPDVVEVATKDRMASFSSSHQPALPGFDAPAESYTRGASGSDAPTGDFRHLIFIEPGMLERGIEVTVAHELIHLSDRVQGRPRKHRCHGSDSISVDEAAITGRDAENCAASWRRRRGDVRSHCGRYALQILLLLSPLYAHLSPCATLCAPGVLWPLLPTLQSRFPAAPTPLARWPWMSIPDFWRRVMGG